MQLLLNLRGVTQKRWHEPRGPLDCLLQRVLKYVHVIKISVKFSSI